MEAMDSRKLCGEALMIGGEEIMRVAGDLGLRPEIVEKDYVLGWVLAGIFHDQVLAPVWIFKGGTCLKKCFFETYRFSEDLDFTITDRTHLDQDFLIERFSQIGQWIYDTTGIEIPSDMLRFDVWNTPSANRAGNERISYRGPLMPGGDLPRIRLDLTTDEALVREPVMRLVGHPYTDAPAESIEARCYAFDEVFGEKVRALGRAFASPGSIRCHQPVSNQRVCGRSGYGRRSRASQMYVQGCRISDADQS